MFKLLTTLLLLTFWISPLEACYLQIDGKSQTYLKAAHSLAFSLISGHVESLKEMPASGLKLSQEDCVYKVSLHDEKQKVLVSVTGRKFNGTGISQSSGLEGFHQALLSALLQSKPELKSSLCEENQNILQAQCGKGFSRATGRASISYQCNEDPCPPESMLKIRATDVAKLVALDELSKIIGVSIQSMQSVKAGRISKSEIETKSGGVLKGVKFSEPIFEGDQVSVTATAELN